MPEPRRWTINACPVCGSQSFHYEGCGHRGQESYRVMEVSEHEEAMAALRVRLAGAEQACAELKTTCEGLAGD